MKRKYLSFILTITFLIGMLPITVNADITTASSWAREPITEAINRGIVPSNLQSNYTQPITRQEFAQLSIQWLEYALGQPIDTIVANAISTNPEAQQRSRIAEFRDTDADYILNAFVLGIINGTTAPVFLNPGVFSPNNSLTRQEAAVMIRRVCVVAGANPTAFVPAADFTDMSDAASWATDGLNFVQFHSLMGGVGGNRFDLQGTFTIEQSIVTFNRINMPVIINPALLATVPKFATLLTIGEQTLQTRAGSRHQIYHGFEYGLLMHYPHVASAPGAYELFGSHSTHLNAFNGNQATPFTPPANTTAHIGIQRAEPWLLTEFRVLLRDNQVPNLTGSKIQVSNDNITWHDFFIITESATREAESHGIEIQLNKLGLLTWDRDQLPTDFKLYAFSFYRPQTQGAWTHFRYVSTGSIAEVEFYGYPQAISILAPNVTTPIPPPNTTSSHEIEMWQLVNLEREIRGIAPLNWNEPLAIASRRHSLDMHTNHFGGHTGSDGSSVRDRARDAGYTGDVGENAAGNSWWVFSNTGEPVFIQITTGDTSASGRVRGFLSSPGHRLNMLNPTWKDLGVGVAGVGHAHGMAWIQKFGREMGLRWYHNWNNGLRDNLTVVPIFSLEVSETDEQFEPVEPPFTSGEIVTFGNLNWTVLEVRDHWSGETYALLLSDIVMETKSRWNITDYLHTFYDTTFTASEKEFIIRPFGEDNVFILSSFEVEQYLPTQSSRIAYNAAGEAVRWHTGDNYLVNTDGSIDRETGRYEGRIVDMSIEAGVRPALWLRLP